MLSYDHKISSLNGAPTPAHPNMASNMNSLGSDPKPLNTIMTPNVSNAASNGRPAPRHHHIWLVTGPAGCGKSTVAEHISETLSVPYIEGDEFHPPANVEKMRNGIPLTDADRWDWLTLLREESLRQLAKGNESVVLTCSALKRKYRDRMCCKSGWQHGKAITSAQAWWRASLRYWNPPSAEETDVISIDVSQSMAAVQRETLDKVLHTIDEAA
ncbi:thermoresistant gluconokinase [Apiospora rasikravindrae]|uniref:Gluconokinase n=1 Tax=Apiospora rasikravindrae TaxID=990691 RepID=A0ABR1T848_9PEZI